MRRIMKIFSLYALLVVVIVSQSQIDWDKIDFGWKTYLIYPSSENAQKFYLLLPNRKEKLNRFSRKEIAIIDFVFKNLDILERQIYSSDTNAVKVAFRLFVISDASNSQSLSIILGKLIRINPGLFLEQLNHHRDLVLRLDALIGNLGHEYIDKIDAQNLEISLRIRSLEMINDPEVKKIKDECIRIMRAQ